MALGTFADVVQDQFGNALKAVTSGTATVAGVTVDAVEM